jgi:hypothetical protein
VLLDEKLEEPAEVAGTDDGVTPKAMEVEEVNAAIGVLQQTRLALLAIKSLILARHARDLLTNDPKPLLADDTCVEAVVMAFSNADLIFGDLIEEAKMAGAAGTKKAGVPEHPQ